MQKSLTRNAFIFLISAALLLTGCGSDGTSNTTVPAYSGNTDPAVISGTNAIAIGETATEALNEAIAADKGNRANPFFLGVIVTDYASTLSRQMGSIARSIIDASNSTGIPVGVILGESDLSAYFPGYCGGTISAPENAFGGDTLNGSIIFSSFCINDGPGGPITINGTAIFAENSNGITISYENFTVTAGGETQQFNATLSCDINFSCEYTSAFVGNDGRVHSIDGYTVVETSTGFEISATLFHYNYGEVSIYTSTEITFGACGIYPDGGEIFITGSTGSYIYVTYDSSCNYTIDGNDGTAAIGPISGSLL